MPRERLTGALTAKLRSIIYSAIQISDEEALQASLVSCTMFTYRSCMASLILVAVIATASALAIFAPRLLQPCLRCKHSAIYCD